MSDSNDRAEREFLEWRKEEMKRRYQRTQDRLRKQAADGNGNTSLRAAVMEANALIGDDTINLPAGTYTRTMAGFNEGHAGTGDLDIRSTISIVGNGAGSTIIDANGMDRVFHVFSNGDLTLQGVTALGGDASENSLANRAGGGIWNDDGTLTLIQSTVTNNTTPSIGGGIAKGASLAHGKVITAAVRPGREAAGNLRKLWFIMTGEMCPWGKGVCAEQREPG